MSKYEVISGPYFSAFGPEKIPYLDTFQAVKGTLREFDFKENMKILIKILTVLTYTKTT